MLRHTAAMRLLHAGVDTTVIALWLGHESVQTTQIYLHADLTAQRASTEPDHPADQHAPAATSHPTSFSRSSKRCDYPDQRQPGHPHRPAPTEPKSG